MKGAKKDNKKQDLLSEDDGTGLLKQVVQFKWYFEIQHTNLTNMAIMFEWFTNASQLERFDTGLIESWSPISQDKLNILCFEKMFDQIRIEETTAKLLSSRKVFVYIVNVDDMKIKWEVLLDLGCLMTDKSDKPEYVYFETKLPILELESLKIKISADKPLLQQRFKEYLNPLQIQIIGSKGIVKQEKDFENVYVSYEFFDDIRTTTNSLPHDINIRWNSKHVHLIGALDQSKFRDQLTTQLVNFQVHDRDELLNTSLKKQLDLLDIEEWLKIEAKKEKPIEVEVIDPKKIGKDSKKELPKKEIPKKDNKKKDIKLGEPIKDVQQSRQYNRNNFGVASYLLVDLLKPDVKIFMLQSSVVPRRQFEDLESANLDLNTTAKQNLPKLQLSSTYMENNCFLLVEFEIAVGIGAIKDKNSILLNRFDIPHLTQTQIQGEDIFETKQLVHKKDHESDQKQTDQKQKDQNHIQEKLDRAARFDIKARTFEKCDQLDKNRGLLEDKAVKQGLLVTNTQIKNSNIILTRRVEHPPSSIFHQQIYNVQEDIFVRKLDKTKVTSDKVFDINQQPDVLYKSIVYKPLKSKPF